jgi:hypothetical protein
MARDAIPGGRERLASCGAAFTPWLLVYFGVQVLGPPARPWFAELPLERSWPVLEWTESLYVSGYLITPLGPLLAPTRAALRRFVATGLLATLVVGALWLLIPVVAVPRPFVPETFWGRMLAAERAWSAHVAAFPSFHVLWALIAADALAPRSRPWALGAWAWAGLVTVSCATTGQHAVLDLAAALLLFVPLRRAGNALARSWGSARVLSPRLHKWYLDCVGDGGDAAIVYLGRVRLGGLRVHYVELLTIGRGGRRERRRRLSSRAPLSRDASGLTVAAPAMGFRGRWEPDGAGLEVALLESPEGSIRWRCHSLAGACELQLPDGQRLTGGGYAEELEMTLPPWALPFRELRWGRFAGSGRSVVWIDWREGLERRWLFVDGAAAPAQRLDLAGVAWPAGELAILPGVVIREADVGRTLLGSLAGLLPRRLGQARETKWLCPGELRVVGFEPIRGDVIHEVVRWA